MTTPKTDPTPAPSAGPTAAEVDALLKRVEETSVPGARTRSPKSIMLDASRIQAKLPDHHVRWVSTTNLDKAVLRRADGYVAVSAEQAGGEPIVFGDLTLMAIPRAKYEARQAEIAELNRLRGNPRSDMDGSFHREAENIARFMRDKHGVTIDPRELIDASSR